jgi:hypothetical protein
MVAPIVVAGVALKVAGDALDVAGKTLDVAGKTLSVMEQAIKGLYGMTSGINAFIDKHIEEMKADTERPLVARTGRVLEMAKFGFGIGYITPVVIIAAGQLLLGNPLTGAAVTLASAATLTNPIAMTCGAIGAVYYGWGALTDVERDELLATLSKGFEIGVELIKAMVRFVVEKTKELLSSKNLEEMKKYIASTAAVFGKSLSDVTHKVVDVVSDGFGAAKKFADETMHKGGDLATAAYGTAKEAAHKTAEGAREAIKKVKRRTNSVDAPQAKKGQGSLLKTPKSSSQEKKR